MHNRFSACICIMRGPLRRCRGRFSSPFIGYISGTERRRLTRHNISNHIACDQSNVVIVPGPRSFPGNECKSTPSCTEDVAPFLLLLLLSLFFPEMFSSPPSSLPPNVSETQTVVSKLLAFGATFKQSLDPVCSSGDFWLMRGDGRRLGDNPETAKREGVGGGAVRQRKYMWWLNEEG